MRKTLQSRQCISVLPSWALNVAGGPPHSQTPVRPAPGAAIQGFNPWSGPTAEAGQGSRVRSCFGRGPSPGGGVTIHRAALSGVSNPRGVARASCLYGRRLRRAYPAFLWVEGVCVRPLGPAVHGRMDSGVARAAVGASLWQGGACGAGPLTF